MGRRLGAIDVGSNGIRLRIVEVSERKPHEVTSARAAVRLGRDVFRFGRLSKGSIEDALRALADFREKLDRAGVKKYRAVATSATREAANGAELVLRARREADIELESIDGIEEARLVHLAVANAVTLTRRSVLADVGGGSTEITVLDGARRTRSASLPLGTVRLLEAWNTDGGAVSRRDLAILSEVVRRALTDVGADLSRADRVVATGGTVTAIAKLCGREGHTVSVDKLDALLHRLRKMTERERIEELGLRPDRADTIVPAAVVVSQVAQAAGAKTIEAPGVGIREGILAELAGTSDPVPASWRRPARVTAGLRAPC